MFNVDRSKGSKPLLRRVGFYSNKEEDPTLLTPQKINVDQAKHLIKVHSKTYLL
ncbi:MAG: hypothetical protein ACW99A_20580 [Candidatus Kariarchaeaceae archaeon]|jgi:hypothetical protein